jgi:hypothetical protein
MNLTEVDMNQTEQILQMLRKGPVTPMDALRQVGSLRLAARIGELKREGHNIITEMVTKRGKKFASYKLIEPKQELETH